MMVMAMVREEKEEVGGGGGGREGGEGKRRIKEGVLSIDCVEAEGD